MKKAIKALFVLLFLILAVSGVLAAEKKNKPEIKTVDTHPTGTLAGLFMDNIRLCMSYNTKDL